MVGSTSPFLPHENGSDGALIGDRAAKASTASTASTGSEAAAPRRPGDTDPVELK